MKGALIVDAVVDSGKVRIVDEFAYRLQLNARAAEWGEGRMLKARLEPAENAATWAHHKHLHGHLLKPVSDWTGYTETELKVEMKARFLPDGMRSTTEMDAEQFDEFNRNVAQCIREEYPSECWDACAAAMALTEQRRSA